MNILDPIFIARCSTIFAQWSPRDFFQLPHFYNDMKDPLSTRWLAYPNQGCTHFPHNIWSLYEYIIHYQSEDSYAHQMV
jgi:hypothetical protein